MIAGRAAPELGGAERYLDIVGVNFYAANEWEVPGGRKLHWDDGSDDRRWMPLHRLLAEVYERYRRPLFMAETSHYGIGRAPLDARGRRGSAVGARARECRWKASASIRFWTASIGKTATHWHNSGLWDMLPTGAGSSARVLNEEYAEACAGATRTRRLR